MQTVDVPQGDYLRAMRSNFLPVVAEPNIAHNLSFVPKLTDPVRDTRRIQPWLEASTFLARCQSDPQNRTLEIIQPPTCVFDADNMADLLPAVMNHADLASVAVDSEGQVLQRITMRGVEVIGLPAPHEVHPPVTLHFVKPAGPE